MNNALHYDPLDFYKENLAPRHKENVADYFDELAKQSKIDVEENRKTVGKYKAALAKIEKLKSKLFWLKFFRVFLFIIAGVLLVLSFVLVPPYVGIPLAIGALLLVFLWLNKKIRAYGSVYDKENAYASELCNEAWRQMQPLNDLFSDTATLSLFEKTYPAFKFEKNFTESTSQDLRRNYDMPEYDNEEVSVIDTLSGHFNNNPFVYLRRLIHRLGTETYRGYRTISWSESYIDSKGVRRTRHRTQTLRAQVVKPKPYYHVDTYLQFGASGAPDLSFSRVGKNINLKSDAQIERMVKRREKKFKKKSQRAISRGESFVGMANSEFDVLFNAENRNNELQFRVMFTPLAQSNMVELILSDDTYGDDFSFYKHCKSNVIRTGHAQGWSMETSAERYKSHSYDEAKYNFESFNNNYFKSVYFDFAPLLAVPVYHEDVDVFKFDLKENEQSYANEEYEALANAAGAIKFAHPSSRTNIILKAQYLGREDDEEIISVTAHSYQTFDRIDTVLVLGGDGRMHAVNVPWVEYVPLSNERIMYTKVDKTAKKIDPNHMDAIREKLTAYIK